MSFVIPDLFVMPFPSRKAMNLSRKSGSMSTPNLARLRRFSAMKTLPKNLNKSRNPVHIITFIRGIARKLEPMMLHSMCFLLTRCDQKRTFLIYMAQYGSLRLPRETHQRIRDTAKAFGINMQLLLNALLQVWEGLTPEQKVEAISQAVAKQISRTLPPQGA